MLCILGYSGWQLLWGQRGFLNYLDLQHEQKEAQTTLESVTAERLALESRVQRMRPESLDADLLEEQAKKLLGFAQPDEKVILLP